MTAPETVAAVHLDQESHEKTDELNVAGKDATATGENAEAATDASAAPMCETCGCPAVLTCELCEELNLCNRFECFVALHPRQRDLDAHRERIVPLQRQDHEEPDAVEMDPTGTAAAEDDTPAPAEGELDAQPEEAEIEPAEETPAVGAVEAEAVPEELQAEPAVEASGEAEEQEPAVEATEEAVEAAEDAVPEAQPEDAAVVEEPEAADAGDHGDHPEAACGTVCEACGSSAVMLCEHCGDLELCNNEQCFDAMHPRRKDRESHRESLAPLPVASAAQPEGHDDTAAEPQDLADHEPLEADAASEPAHEQPAELEAEAEAEAQGTPLQEGHAADAAPEEAEVEEAVQAEPAEAVEEPHAEVEQAAEEAQDEPAEVVEEPHAEVEQAVEEAQDEPAEDVPVEAVAEAEEVVEEAVQAEPAEAEEAVEEAVQAEAVAEEEAHSHSDEAGLTDENGSKAEDTSADATPLDTPAADPIDEASRAAAEAAAALQHLKRSTFQIAMFPGLSMLFESRLEAMRTADLPGVSLLHDAARDSELDLEVSSADELRLEEVARLAIEADEWKEVRTAVLIGLRPLLTYALTNDRASPNHAGYKRLLERVISTMRGMDDLAPQQELAALEKRREIMSAHPHLFEGMPTKRNSSRSVMFGEPISPNSRTSFRSPASADRVAPFDSSPMRTRSAGRTVLSRGAFNPFSFDKPQHGRLEPLQADRDILPRADTDPLHYSPPARGRAGSRARPRRLAPIEQQQQQDAVSPSKRWDSPTGAWDAARAVADPSKYYYQPQRFMSPQRIEEAVKRLYTVKKAPAPLPEPEPIVRPRGPRLLPDAEQQMIDRLYRRPLEALPSFRTPLTPIRRAH